MIEKQKVSEHYKADGLMARLAASLKSAGLEDGPLTIEQLAPLDQFHSRGLEATIELARMLQPSPSDRVIDIGAGLGGPSRYLAATFGCTVTGIDLSEAFVEAAGYLAKRAGLSNKVSYQQGDALALPFDDGSFDLAWTQHVAMNIADRATFYREGHRVLRQGGRLAIYDVLAGGGGPLIYPVPWAKNEHSSHLVSPSELRDVLVASGFEVVSWVDRTDAALAWFAQLRKQQPAAGSGGVGLHLAMGDEFKTMTGNLARNLDEGRALLVEAVLSKSNSQSR